MARNKDFFTNNSSKRDRSFFVKETKPISTTSVENVKSEQKLNITNNDDYRSQMNNTRKVTLEKEMSEIETKMKDLDKIIRGYYPVEEREQAQKEYTEYKKQYYNKKSEIETLIPQKVQLNIDNSSLSKNDAKFSGAPIDTGISGKVMNFTHTTLPETLGKTADNIKEPFTGPSLNKLITEAKLSPQLLADDAKIQLQDKDPSKFDYALVKQTKEAVEKYGMEDSKIKAISGDNTKLLADLESAEKTWQVSPVDALGANTLAAGASIFGNLGSFANSLGADKVPLLKEVTNFAVDGARKAQENAQQYNRGSYGEALGTVTQGVVNLVPYFLFGTGKAAAKGAVAVTKYGKYIEPIIKNPSFWYSLTSMWGQKYQEKLDEGNNRLAALGNAIIYALPASLIEVSGGIGAKGKETQSLLRTMGEEIGEEIAQDIVSGVSDKIVTNHDLPVFSTTEDAIINPKELAKTAVYTAPIVAIGGGANRVINNAISNKSTNKQNTQPTKSMQSNAEIVKNKNDNQQLALPSAKIYVDEQGNAMNTEQYAQLDVNPEAFKKRTNLINDINKSLNLSETDKADVLDTVNKMNLTTEIEQGVRDFLNAVENPNSVQLNSTELKNINNNFNENKAKYAKYANEIEGYNPKYIENAKNIINTKDGRKTKEQWLQVAKSLGNQIYEMSDADVEMYAYKTWADTKPNNPQVLNRQGKKFVKFTMDEWVNTVYDTVRNARQRTQLSNDNANVVLPTKAEQEAINYSPVNSRQRFETRNLVTDGEGRINILPTQKVQETVRSAKLAGMTDFDVKRATELNNMLQSGAKLRFYNANNLPEGVNTTAKEANGFYSNGTLWINKDSKRQVEKILGHELTHYLEKTSSYNDFANAVLDNDVFYDYITSQGYATKEDFKNNLRQRGYADEVLDSEMVAMFIEDNLFSNQGSINRIARKNATLAEKIKNFISDLKVKFKGTAQEKQLLKIENMYRKALEQARRQGTNSNNQIAYSKNVLEDGTIYIKTTENNFLKPDGTKMTPREAYNSLVGTTLQFPDGQTATIVKNLPQKDMYNELYRRNPTYKNVQDIKSVNNTVNDNIVELLENSELTNTSPDFNNRHVAQGINNFDTRKVTFFDGETAYDITFSIAELKDGSKVAYAKKFLEPNEDVLKKIKKAETSSKSPVNPPSNNSINQNDSSVNTQYSLDKQNDTAGKEPAFSMPTDNKGKKLSEKQQEYFKNSKIRDDKGRLIEVYHRTNQDFTEFDRNKIGSATDDGFWGRGFYFSNLDHEHYGKNVIKGYLNITNPLVMRDFKSIQEIAEYLDIVERNFHYEPDGLIRVSYDQIRQFTSHVIEKGHDGVIAEHDNGVCEYVIFEPNQIKEVTNTEPTENPDIRYSKNPVEIAKNPPNIESGLDPLRRMSREKEGNKQSSFTKNIYNQNIFDDKFKDLALDDKNIRTYESISNKETLQQANDDINEQGQKWVDRFLDKSNGEMKATDIAGGFILMNRYQQVGDYESMIRVAEKLRKAGTQQGQTIQMFSVLGRMTPEGMTYYAQKTLSDAYDEILKNKTQKWADEHKDEFKLNEKDIDFIQRRVNQAARLPEGRDKYVLLGEIAARIQNKIPPQASQSIKALARNSMLLNPKTMIRNILGNTVIVPNHIISDFIGAGIDKAISNKTGTRTTGVFDIKSLKGLKKGLYESFDDFRRDISTRELAGDRFEIGKGGKSFNENHTGVLATQRNALSKALNGLDRVTGFLLESGDRPFYETWFINSLNNQMKLNNAEKPTAEMIEIATDEALQRTWQDNNTYTKAVSGVRNSLNKFNIKGYGLGDMVMPFVKTPANLTKAVVEFSPLGAINAALKTSQFRKEISKGQATSKQQREVVKAWSQVITGSLGMAIMTVLANAGVLGGGSDEDKDVRSFEQNILGVKPYSIKIGDKTYTYDWAQPLGTSAAIVADMTKSLKNADSTEGKVAAVLKGLQSGASVLLDQSFVSGIRNLFEEDNLINALIETGFNEGAKFTPQFLSQIAQLQDDTARTSYVYNNIPKTALNKVKAKIPGLRQTLEPSVDVLGREVKTDNSIGNVMFNPANTAFARSTKGAEEMYKVYQSTGDKAAIAQVAPYYFNIGSEKIVLTPQQRTQYQKTTGKIASDGVENLLNNSAYKSLDDVDKAEILKELYSYGNAIAKEEASTSYLLPSAMEKIKNSGMKPEEYILLKYIANSSGTKKDEMYNALINSGYKQSEVEKFLTEYKGYKFDSTSKNSLPTLSSQRAKLPTLKK